MSISFKSQFRDQLWFAYHCMIPELRRAWWLIPALCLFFLMNVRTLNEQVALIEVLRLGAIALVVVLLFPFLSTLVVYSVARVRLPRGTSFSQDQVVSLAETSVLVRSPRTQLEILWLDIRKLVQTKRYLILRFQKFGVLLIPRRAFQSEQQWRDFYAYCERKAHDV